LTADILVDDEDGMDMRDMNWRWESNIHHGRHGSAPRSWNPWGVVGVSAPDGHIVPLQGSYRSHRAVTRQRPADDGINPLLQRHGTSNVSLASRARDAISDHFAISIDPIRETLTMRAGQPPTTFINNIMNLISQGRATLGGPSVHGVPVHVHLNDRSGGIPADLFGPPRSGTDFGSPFRFSQHRRGQEQSSRASRDDPVHIVHFEPLSTTIRWQEEARILFAGGAAEKAALVIPAIHRLLVPPARKAQREKEEADLEQRVKAEAVSAANAKEEAEKKEREDREAREEKAREDQEAAEAAEAEAVAAREAGSAVEADAVVDADAMSGVEEIQVEEPIQQTEPEAEPSASAAAPRVTARFRDRDLDITGLGIDAEYLDALPDEIREEVLMTQVIHQRAQAAATGSEPTGFDQTFLEALPLDIRAEIVQAEAVERRRREREEARRRTTSATTGPGSARAEEMDPASFFATLDPSLRQSLLMDADEELLSHLPSDIAAEARALGGGQTRYYAELQRRNAIDRPPRAAVEESSPPKRTRPHQYVQILDKAGVATLLRLMFIPQQGSAKQSLNEILRHVCQNKQNRAEVVSILLSILQDGSNDIGSVERSFAHLSVRAKQPSGALRMSQPKRPSTDPSPSIGDMSPLMVVQQCLNTLTYLTQFNPRIIDFFLTEHETNTGFKSRSARKGKSKDSKSSRYPVNALLGLLDRKLVIDSLPVMEQLAQLLQIITTPLAFLIKKAKEDKKEAAATVESAPSAPELEPAEIHAETAIAPEQQQEVSQSVSMEDGTLEDDPGVEQHPEATVDQEDDKPKKARGLHSPPEVSEHNLRLVVNIIAARECSGKTFKNTLALITHLSSIPEAKAIFGQELIRQAQTLGKSILNDLQALNTQIGKSNSGTDVQGLALSRFSPASSDQTKLLRVITALDYLFDPKRKEWFGGASSTDKPSSSTASEDDILVSMYENDTFGPLWGTLSDCLTAIRERGNMFNIATILLPLIEVLMVVCKNTSVNEVSVRKQKEFSVSSPPPETKMEGLFFRFTEDHRKILNDLVRHNPKLMSGSFSLLVKNSKVLEFDNKRNFFHRKLHTRNPAEVRQSHPSLQLSVRRADVFRDSFKSLYYKKPEELKYGKLNIRFHGEEGVDAGGVTREWFQVLVKQMFNPNYALFNPVASDRTTFHPNPFSSINGEHLTFFKFIGRIIGKALYESRVLDCHFSRAVYKRMLGKPVSIKDMETLDLDYYKSLVWMLENDITDIITETFSIETEAFDLTKVVDLIPNGRNVPVTDENKQEYVQLVVDHKMIGSVTEQLQHFLDGKTLLTNASIFSS
jgi:E3 ubiquitin-protein ligase HUWE1